MCRLGDRYLTPVSEGSKSPISSFVESVLLYQGQMVLEGMYHTARSLSQQSAYGSVVNTMNPGNSLPAFAHVVQFLCFRAPAQNSKHAFVSSAANVAVDVRLTGNDARVEELSFRTEVKAIV